MTTTQSPSEEITTELPTWFTNLQTQAQEEYQSTPTPTRSNQNWRFGDLKQLNNIDDFTPAAFADSEDIDIQIKGLDQTSAQFIFANDSLVHAEADLPESVICLPLEDALAQHPELVQKHLFQNEPTLGSSKYAALHKANVTAGLFIHVPKGIEIEHPIEVYHIVSGENNVIFPHTLIVTEDNAKVTVVDYFTSTTGEATQKSRITNHESTTGEATKESQITNHESQIPSHLIIAMNDLVTGQGSSLNYTAIQNLGLADKLISINNTQVQKDANAKSFILNLGAAWARNESLSILNGNGSNSDMLSLSIPTGDQKFDQRTFQHHAAPHTYSDLLYKNTLYGKSKTTFSGLIAVDEGAHFTDAYQTCRNLLMDDTTETNSMPGLQINADQVKCSHGSTASAISDEEIFYLQARGITPKHARQLIARGFNVEVIERLKNEQLETLVLNYIDKKFATVA